jgi:hypothetical protein
LAAVEHDQRRAGVARLRFAVDRDGIVKRGQWRERVNGLHVTTANIEGNYIGGRAGVGVDVGDGLPQRTVASVGRVGDHERGQKISPFQPLQPQLRGIEHAATQRLAAVGFLTRIGGGFASSRGAAEHHGVSPVLGKVLVQSRTLPLKLYAPAGKTWQENRKIK